MTHWERGYSHLEEYYRKNGHSIVPLTYVCDDGYRLGAWVIALRNRRKKGILTDERIAALDRFNFVWDWRKMCWENGCEHLRAYSEKYKDTLVPKGYICEDGFQLGVWVRRQRLRLNHDVWNQRKLTRSQIEQLDKLGMEWESYDVGGRKKKCQE